MVDKFLYFEDLRIGMSAEMARIVEDQDVVTFARISGDDNPLHLDEAYAATTPFKERIAHGILTASYISALLGARLPGPGAIYVSQTLSFKRPVRIGDKVEARVEIIALDPDKARVVLACSCAAAGKRVLEGEATVLAPRRPA